MHTYLDPNAALEEFLRTNDITLAQLLERLSMPEELDPNQVSIWDTEVTTTDTPSKKKSKSGSKTSHKKDRTTQIKVTAVDEPAAAVKSILERSTMWKDMSQGEKFAYAKDVVEWMMHEYNLGSLYLMVDDDPDNYGQIVDDTLSLSHSNIIKEDSPTQLFQTTGHELKHRTQALLGMTIKKNDAYTQYFPLDYLYLMQITDYDSDLKNLIYDTSPMELDANIGGAYMLDLLYNILDSTMGIDAEYATIANELVDSIDEHKTELLDDIITIVKKEVALGDEIDCVKDDARKWMKSMYMEISANSKIDNEAFSEYMSDDEVYKALEHYISITSNASLIDTDIHKKLTKIMLDHDRIEGVLLVNHVYYQHSPEELMRAAKILEADVNDEFLLPAMIRQLTHIEQREIIAVCNHIIGLEATDRQRQAMTRVLQSQLDAHPHLRQCRDLLSDNGTRTVDPSDLNDCSLIINNIYPDFAEDFVGDFCYEYVAAMRDIIANDNSISANDKVVLMNNNQASLEELDTTAEYSECQMLFDEIGLFHRKQDRSNISEM